MCDATFSCLQFDSALQLDGETTVGIRRWMVNNLLLCRFLSLKYRKHTNTICWKIRKDWLSQTYQKKKRANPEKEKTLSREAEGRTET